MHFIAAIAMAVKKCQNWSQLSKKIQNNINMMDQNIILYNNYFTMKDIYIYIYTKIIGTMGTRNDMKYFYNKCSFPETTFLE